MATSTSARADGLEELPLSAMLSVALVAFTIECDDELEVALGRSPGMPSLVTWLNLLQYLRDGPRSVDELCSMSRTSMRQVSFLVGKLEFWGHVSVTTPSARGGGATRAPGRPARQSVSAVKRHSVVELADRATPGVELWPQVIDDVESRWQQRHGSALTAALKAAAGIGDRAGLLLPDGLPVSSANRAGSFEGRQVAPGKLTPPAHARVPVLLSRALFAARIVYEQRALVPLAIAANTLRVIEEGGTPAAQLYQLSGTTPETAASQITWLTKGVGMAELVTEPPRRTKLVRLTALGKEAQAAYLPTMGEVDAVADPDGKATAAFRRLLATRKDGDLAIRAALTPAEGTCRAGGDWTPPNGRPLDARDRQIAEQARAYVSDPFRALPHFPVWEQTRGFGP